MTGLARPGSASVEFGRPEGTTCYGVRHLPRVAYLPGNVSEQRIA